MSLLSFEWEINRIKHLKQIDCETISQGLSITVSITAPRTSGPIDQNCHHLSKVYQLTSLRVSLPQIRYQNR